MAGRRSKEEKERTRRRLLATAARIFSRRGFHGATLEEIASGADLTTGAIYSNFADKADLFLAVYEEEVATRAREIDAAIATAQGADSRAAKAADQWMDRLAANPQWFPAFAEFWAYAVRRPELRERFAVALGAVRIAVGRHLERRAVERGYELPAPAEELGTMLKALGNGMALEKLGDPEGVPDELFADALEIFLTGVEARGRSRSAHTSASSGSSS